MTSQEKNQIFWQLLDLHYYIPKDVSDEDWDQHFSEKFPLVKHLNLYDNDWKGVYIEINNHANQEQIEYVKWMIPYVFGLGRDSPETREAQKKLKEYYDLNRPQN